jgi:diketogulonate reductase-like aldo/keto reductase
MLLLHWPVKEVPFAEQLRALDSVRQDGRAGMIGVSNYTVAQMKEVTEDIGAPIATNQVEYHPYLSQAPVLEFVRSHDMFLTAYSPLARGKIRNDEALQTIARKHGKSVGQICLRWLVQQDRVAAIPKAGSEEHIRENFDIFSFELDSGDMNKIHALGHEGGRLINPEWAPDWDSHKAA